MPRGCRGSPRIATDGTEPIWTVTCGFRTAATPHEPRCYACKVEAQIARLLVNAFPHWVGGDPAEIDPPGVHLDEEQHVETAEQHRIDGEEVAGQNGPRLRPQELCPGWARSARSGLGAMPAEDCPRARRSEPNAHSCQFPMDSAISPGRVLSCQTKDQRDRARWNRRSSRPPVRVGPLPSHELSMPAQQSLRLDEGSTPRRAIDSSRLNPASTARSAGCRAGRATCRRKTATSWRSMTISMVTSSCPLRERRTN